MTCHQDCFQVHHYSKITKMSMMLQIFIFFWSVHKRAYRSVHPFDAASALECGCGCVLVRWMPHAYRRAYILTSWVNGLIPNPRDVQGSTLRARDRLLGSEHRIDLSFHVIWCEHCLRVFFIVQPIIMEHWEFCVVTV